MVMSAEIMWFREMQTNPKGRTVVICEHMLMPFALKQALCETLFDAYKVCLHSVPQVLTLILQVLQISFVPEPVLAVFAADCFRGDSDSPTVATDGLVINCSYHDSYVVPVSAFALHYHYHFLSPLGSRLWKACPSVKLSPLDQLVFMQSIQLWHML